MIYGIVGVIVWTDDLDRLIAFYTDTLGFSPHSITPHFVSFKLGEMRLGIGTHSEVSGANKALSRVIVNLGVADIHNEYRRLCRNGVEFVRVPEKEHWGGWVATFTDPDGNMLQMLELAD